MWGWYTCKNSQCKIIINIRRWILNLCEHPHMLVNTKSCFFAPNKKSQYGGIMCVYTNHGIIQQVLNALPQDFVQCYASNWGRKDCKLALGPITWSGSDVWTRQRRLSTSRELWLQPSKVAPLAPTCSWISEHQDTKSYETQTLRGWSDISRGKTRGRLSSK